MTVTAELAKRSHRLEYVLCIEGIGWPVNVADLSSGFAGDVFVDADLDGDIATQLGGDVTVHKGLRMPSSISDRFDPETNTYSAGGLTFDIIDLDDTLRDTIRPLRPGKTQSANKIFQLKVALTLGATTVDLEASTVGSSTEPAGGDVIWVGGREAIKLGTKSTISGGFRYTSSTRAYLGTPLGSYDYRSVPGGQFTHRVETICYLDNPFWNDRTVILFAHVPGEANTELVRIYTGRLRDLARADYGLEWKISTVAQSFNGLNRMHVPMRGWAVAKNGLEVVGWAETDFTTSWGLTSSLRLIGFDLETPDADHFNDFGMGSVYTYRTAVGGTANAVTEAFGADSSEPQSETAEIDTGPVYDDTKYIANSILKIGDYYMRALWKPETATIAANINVPMSVLFFEPSDIRGAQVPRFQGGEPVTFCLDNMQEIAAYNRFTVNGVIRRNIVDVLLIFLTTMPTEYYVADAAASGTTTTVNFTSPGWAADQWAGYALHCVEGTNKGQARLITGNDSDTITVDIAFSASTHSGNQYQIRNSIYDVLPIGWGLGVHNSQIDIAQMEDLRDKYCVGLEVGKFVIGSEDKIDLWSVLEENICKPYGLMLYTDRLTGSLSLRWMNEPLSDGVDETYVTVSASDILPGSLRDFEMMARAPISEIQLFTRSQWALTVAVPIGAPGQTIDVEVARGTIAAFDSKPAITTIRQMDVAQQFQDLDAMQVYAMFNDYSQTSELVKLLLVRLLRRASPPPETTLSLDIRHVVSIQAGSLIMVTAGSGMNADNPYALHGATSTSGWSNQLCRVISTSINLSASQPSLECRVQVLSPVVGAKIAPAVQVNGKGGTGAGGDPYYFAIADSNAYINNAEDLYDYTDWSTIGVGDRLELRLMSGAFVEGPFVVASFGANEASTPAAASTAQINVTTSITNNTWTGGRYLTFSPWTDSNSANMENHAAFADAANETLGAGNDAAKEWA